MTTVARDRSDVGADDGIMAAFVSAWRAVEAAPRIQRDVAATRYGCGRRTNPGRETSVLGAAPAEAARQH